MPQPPLCQSRRAQNVRLWNKSFAEGDGGNAPEWGLFIFLWGIPFWRGIWPGALCRVRRARAEVRLSDARTPNLAPRAVWGAHAGTVLPGIGGTLRRGGGRAAGDVRPRRDLSPSAASASQRAFGGSLCHGKWCSDCLWLDCPIGRSLCPRQMGRALSLDVRRSPSLRRFRVSPGRGSAEGQGTGPDVKARRPVARTGRMDYGLKR